MFCGHVFVKTNDEVLGKNVKEQVSVKEELWHVSFALTPELKSKGTHV